MRIFAAALAVLIVGTVGGCSELRTDPTENPQDGSTFGQTSEHSWGIEARIGEPFTDGLEVLKLSGTETVKLLRVELVGATGMELAGAYVVGPDRGIGSIQYLPNFPPNHRLLRDRVPVEGAVLDPGAADSPTWELLLGIEITAEGRKTRDGVKVVYQVGDEVFQQTLPARLAVCTKPALAADGLCEGPPLSFE